MKTIQQQIINFLDQNDGATFGQVQAEFKDQSMFAMLAFEELIQAGDIVQVVSDKLLGTYNYKLPA